MSVSSLLSPQIVCCYFYYFFIGLCFYILALHLHTPCGSIANLYLSDLLLSLSTFVKRIIFLTNLIFHPGCLPPCYIAFITRCFYLLEKVNTFSIQLFIFLVFISIKAAINSFILSFARYFSKKWKFYALLSQETQISASQCSQRKSTPQWQVLVGTVSANPHKSPSP